jgi:hypothetical protein
MSASQTYYRRRPSDGKLSVIYWASTTSDPPPSYLPCRVQDNYHLDDETGEPVDDPQSISEILPDGREQVVDGEWDGTILNANAVSKSTTVLERVVPANQFAQGAPKRRWMIEKLLPEGTSGFIAGLEKTMKSFVAIDLALALASGQDFAGQRTSRPYSVMLISEELDPVELARRLDMLARNRNIKWRELNNMLVLGARTGLRADVPGDVRNGNIVGSGGQLEIEQYVAGNQVDFVILDPFRSFFLGDENNARDVRAVLYFLDSLSRKHGCGVFVVHHDRKAGRGSNGKPTGGNESDALRGSGDLRAWYSTLFHLQKGNLSVKHRNARDAGKYKYSVDFDGAKCPNCNYQSEDTGSTCPDCGAQLDDLGAVVNIVPTGGPDGVITVKDSGLAQKVVALFLNFPKAPLSGNYIATALNRSYSQVKMCLDTLIKESTVTPVLQPKGAVRYALSATIASAMRPDGDAPAASAVPPDYEDG